MATKNAKDPNQQFLPVRVTPPAELIAYTVHEHELDIIAAGSPVPLTLNFAVALVSVGVSFVLTLTTTTITSDRLFYGYLIACINLLIIGIILFVYWVKNRSSVSITVAKIKARSEVALPIQGTATAGTATTP